MAATLTGTRYAGLPGAVQLFLDGAPHNGDVFLYRILQNGGRVPVRNGFAKTDGSGRLHLVDAEAPFGFVHYEALKRKVNGDGYIVVATSDPVYVPPLPDGKALLRAVLSPDTAWAAVTLEDITDISREVVSTRWTVMGRSDPVVSADVRQTATGVLSVIVGSLLEADELIYRIFRDGVPVLVRLCPEGRTYERDMYVIFSGLRESRVRFKSHYRRLVVDWVEIPAPTGAGDEIPVFLTWDYDDVVANWPDYSRVEASYLSYDTVYYNQPIP